MARTYLSTLSPRRRWGIASASAGTALALAAGLGNPWSFSAISGLPKDSGADSVPLLASALQVFHWTTGSAEAGGSSAWIAGFVLDLAWPLLILVGARALAGGLSVKRARLSLVVGVWSLATLTGAFSGLIAGLIDHRAGPGGARAVLAAVTPATRTGDVLVLQAAAMALVGALLGWLPGVAASVAYSVNRTAPAESEAKAKTGKDAMRSGDEKTVPDLDVESTGTLSLEGLEQIRRARRQGEGGRLPDARTSEFFKV